MSGGLGKALVMILPWLKAGHVIFVIFWVAGLLMLPRFHVYHAEAATGSAEAARWVDREAKLRTIILAPSILMVWTFGLLLAWTTDAWSQGWFQAKLLLVVLLSAYHGWLVAFGKRLAAGGPAMSGSALRILGEVPGILVVLIVILVIVRPF